MTTMTSRKSITSKRTAKNGQRPKQTPAGDACPPANSEVPHAIQRRIQLVGKKLSGYRQSSVIGRHVLALEVMGVLGERSKYAAYAAATLEQSTGYDRKTLYRWASVGKTWPRAAAFRRLASRKGPGDFGLTWSHFELLATVDGVSKIERLIEVTLKEQLSVRALQERLGAAKGSSPAAKTHPVTKITSPVAVAEMAHALSKEQRKLRSSLAAISKTKLGEAVATSLQELLTECQSTAMELAHLLDSAPAGQSLQPEMPHKVVAAN